VINKNPSTASEMKRSSSIKLDHWPAIVRGAAERHIPGVSFESLARMNLRGRDRRSERGLASRARRAG
jgi:hypothetical protein